MLPITSTPDSTTLSLVPYGLYSQTQLNTSLLLSTTSGSKVQNLDFQSLHLAPRKYPRVKCSACVSINFLGMHFWVFQFLLLKLYPSYIAKDLSMPEGGFGCHVFFSCHPSTLTAILSSQILSCLFSLNQISIKEVYPGKVSECFPRQCLKWVQVPLGWFGIWAKVSGTADESWRKWTTSNEKAGRIWEVMVWRKRIKQYSLCSL